MQWMINNTIDKLMELSKIFKQGFTVEIKNGDINQYTNYKKPYIINCLTIATIINNKPIYKGIKQLTNNCIIGGWYDSDTNIYYIEINKSYKHKNTALYYAKLYNQKAIYNIKTGDVIEV